MSHATSIGSQLQSGYSRRIRQVEWASIVLYGIGMATLAVRVWPWTREYPVWAFVAVFVAYLAADFVSGFVHWMADTWGSIQMPVIGKLLIRPFREHHVDPRAMTHHDFIETNGNNCLVSLVPEMIALCLPIGRPVGAFAASFIGWFLLWIFATNQFHKWAHLPAPPKLIHWLQATWLILPPKHHDLHHVSPFNRHYCITSGWLNVPLASIRFFPTLERWMTRWTGMIPRQDNQAQTP